MKFFFADSQDMIDPSFDFTTERRSPHRKRQRNDLYPHEVFARPPYAGMLISMAVVQGTTVSSGRYTIAQRQRLYRTGVRDFLRLKDTASLPLAVMGDCGAFNYVKEEVPPITTEEVVDFYHELGFDYGISVDHVISGHQEESNDTELGASTVPAEWSKRQQLTLSLAAEFLAEHRRRKCRFTPIGVAQGWGPSSYSRAVVELQRQGYRNIAIGGLVTRKTHQILACLQAVSLVRRPDARLHLLGITRLDHLAEFRGFGVRSFDSTTPLRQAFMSNRANYHTRDKNYVAIRVPMTSGNALLEARIREGHTSLGEALAMEKSCLAALDQFQARGVSPNHLIELLDSYTSLLGDDRTSANRSRDLLEDRPWDSCPCEVCTRVGIHVAVFRGAERNKRRGFHNLFVFEAKMRAKIDTASNKQPRLAAGATEVQHDNTRCAR